MNVIKKSYPFVILLVLLIVIRNISVSLLDSVQNKSAKELLEKELSEAKRRNQYLTERLFYVQTDEFVKEEAQEKLGMLREGEVIIIAPTASQVADDFTEPDTRSNLQKWLELFF